MGLLNRTRADDGRAAMILERRFELLRHVLQHLYVGRDTLRLDRTSGRGEVARGGQPQRAIAGAERNDGLHRALAERTDTRGEASLRGHLKSEGDEQTGSQSYIPPDPKDDKALHTALDLIRGIQKNSAYPPNPKTAVPN